MRPNDIAAVLVILVIVGWLLLIIFWKLTNWNNIEKIEKKIQVAKNELSSGKLVEAHQILKECLDTISTWNGAVEGVKRQGYKKLAPKIDQLLQDVEREDRFNQKLLALEKRSKGATLSDEIEKLAMLRSEGMISDHEFDAFSERFKVSTGEKAKGIISAISDLYAQYKIGAMSEGNYHAGLWSLLDKLDRKT